MASEAQDIFIDARACKFPATGGAPVFADIFGNWPESDGGLLCFFSFHLINFYNLSHQRITHHLEIVVAPFWPEGRTYAVAH